VISNRTILPFPNLPFHAKIAFEKGAAEKGMNATHNYNGRFASTSRIGIPGQSQYSVIPPFILGIVLGKKF